MAKVGNATIQHINNKWYVKIKNKNFQFSDEEVPTIKDFRVRNLNTKAESYDVRINGAWETFYSLGVIQKGGAGRGVIIPDYGKTHNTGTGTGTDNGTGGNIIDQWAAKMGVPPIVFYGLGAIVLFKFLKK